MTSQPEFAKSAEPFLERMVERLTDEHAAQYYDKETELQAFETCELTKLIDWAEDEAVDLATYGLMYYTRLQRLRKVTDYIQGRLHRSLALLGGEAALLKQTVEHAWQDEPDLKHDHPVGVLHPPGPFKPPMGEKDLCPECGEREYQRLTGDKGHCLHCGWEGTWR